MSMDSHEEKGKILALSFYKLLKRLNEELINISRKGSYLDSVKVAIASSDPDVFLAMEICKRICYE
jgi:hypothetical protein